MMSQEECVCSLLYFSFSSFDFHFSFSFFFFSENGLQQTLWSLRPACTSSGRKWIPRESSILAGKWIVEAEWWDDSPHLWTGQGLFHQGEQCPGHLRWWRQPHLCKEGKPPGCCHTHHTSLLYTILFYFVLYYSLFYGAVAQMVVLFPRFSRFFIFLPRFVEIFMASSMICLKCLRQLNSPKEDHSRSEGDTSSWVSFFFYLWLCSFPLSSSIFYWLDSLFTPSSFFLLSFFFLSFFILRGLCWPRLSWSGDHDAAAVPQGSPPQWHLLAEGESWEQTGDQDIWVLWGVSQQVWQLWSRGLETLVSPSIPLIQTKTTKPQNPSLFNTPFIFISLSLLLFF